jgi:hypothetical protein
MSEQPQQWCNRALSTSLHRKTAVVGKPGGSVIQDVQPGDRGDGRNIEGEPQRYFFLHIPKTAGMTLYHRLIQCHGDTLYPLPPDRGSVEAAMDVDFLANCFSEFRDQIRVIVGHYPLCIDEVLGVPLKSFTLLRDPVERTLSFLRWRKQQIPHVHDVSLEDLYGDPYLLHAWIHNYMVKVLSMTAAEMQKGAVTMVPYDDVRLERAKHNLEHRIEVFGLQEEFEDFCRQLSSDFGWDLGEDVLLTNQTMPVDVSDELRERIAQDSALDVELYRFATDLWERRRANRPTSSADLQPIRHG